MPHNILVTPLSTCQLSYLKRKSKSSRVLYEAEIHTLLHHFRRVVENDMNYLLGFRHQVTTICSSYIQSMAPRLFSQLVYHRVIIYITLWVYRRQRAHTMMQLKRRISFVCPMPIIAVTQINCYFHAPYFFDIRHRKLSQRYNINKDASGQAVSLYYRKDQLYMFYDHH